MGPAGDGATFYQFAGVTEQILGGGAGLTFAAYYCNSNFPGSRMCTSDEVLKSGNIANSNQPHDYAWVRPSYEPVGSYGGFWGLDITGIEFDPDHGSLSCDGMTSYSVDDFGLAIMPAKGFRVLTCDQGAHVACCAPVE